MLAGKGDRLTSVVLPLGICAVGAAVLVKGYYGMITGTSTLFFLSCGRFMRAHAGQFGRSQARLAHPTPLHPWLQASWSRRTIPVVELFCAASQQYTELLNRCKTS